MPSNTKSIRCLALLLGLTTGTFLLPAKKAYTQPLIDAETGAVFPGQNNVIQVPQTEANTRFNAFGPGFVAKPVLNLRLRLGYTFAGRHTVSVLYAPYTTSVTYRGSGSSGIVFNNVPFNLTNGLRVGYRFNGYRLTYRYDFIRIQSFWLGTGLTLNLRDAYIEADESGRTSRYTNYGLVPLLNVYVRWQPANRFSALLESDAFAVNNGRAIDVFGALTYRLGNRLHLKAGYRFFDGGADGPETYNSLRTNSAVVGLRYGLSNL